MNCVNLRDVSSNGSLSRDYRFVKLSEFEGDLFGHFPDIISRPKPPKRENSVDKWLPLGAPVLRVLARLAHDAP